MIVDREEIVNGGGYGNGGFMMLAVFLVVLFSLFRGHGFGNGEGAGLAGGIGGLTAAADFMTFNRYTNYEDPAVARIEKQNAIDTGAIIHAMDVQTCEIEKAVGRSIKNQDRLALEAERMFYGNVIDQKNEKIAEQRLVISEQNAKALQQEALAATNMQFCVLNNRITQIQDDMLTKPPFYAAGGVPFVNQCVPAHLAAGYAGGCCA